MSPSRIDSDESFEVKEGGDRIVSYDINLPFDLRPEDAERTEFPAYLPNFDKVFHPDFPKFKYNDPALRANPNKPHLFVSGVTAKAVTPRMGTILTGVKLDKLCQKSKDELALLISERKFVVLREQLDFLNAGPQFQSDFMSHYGKLSRQPVTAAIKGYPQFHIIHRDNNEVEIAKFLQKKSSTCLWHHDVSYEHQPPGYIMLGILACPDVGGDTVVADTVEAYKRLSPAFQELLQKVSAVHSSDGLISFAKAMGGTIRSNPVNSTHPLVRVHPVTGEKAIFYNKEFPKEILGLKDREAEAVTSYLMEHMAMGHDFQARVHWEKHSVVMFDGRQTLHTGTVDYDSSLQARHLFRLAAMTEVPITVEEWERRQSDA